MDAKSDCSILNQNGQSVFHLSVNKNNHEAIKLLLSREIYIDFKDKSDHTPLSLAITKLKKIEDKGHMKEVSVMKDIIKQLEKYLEGEYSTIL